MYANHIVFVAHWRLVHELFTTFIVEIGVYVIIMIVILCNAYGNNIIGYLYIP